MRTNLRTRSLAGSVALLATLALPGGGVDAASATSLYAYDLRSSSPYLNSAPQSNAVPMALYGDWSSTSDGVMFTGHRTTSYRSVGVVDPPGATIDVSGGTAVGAVVDFTFRPPSVETCPRDSKNLAQIGRFGTGEAQLKLQLGACSAGVVKPQCRVAGANTPKGAAPVTGTGTVQPGRRYVLECIKSPDVGGSASVTVRLTDVAAGTTTTKTASIPDTGRIASSRPLSIANKYPMPKPARNTDQFRGLVRRVEVCSGTSVPEVRSCLG